MTTMILDRPIARFYTGDGAGGGGGGSAATPPADPFAGIELDDLPADQRAILESARTQVATLQTERANFEKQAKVKQSEADRLAAELDKVKKQLPGATPPPPKTAVEEVYEMLIADGMPPEAAQKQAPFFASFMGLVARKVEGNVAGAMAPFVQSTLGQQATASFQAALHADPLNAFGVPEVKASVLESCQAIVAQGGNVTPEVVDNLRAMAYVKHLQNGGKPAGAPETPRVATLQTPSLTTGGTPFSFTAAPPAPSNPNAPRTTLGPNETLALTNIMGHWIPGRTKLA